MTFTCMFARITRGNTCAVVNGSRKHKIFKPEGAYMVATNWETNMSRNKPTWIVFTPIVRKNINNVRKNAH